VTQGDRTFTYCSHHAGGNALIIEIPCQADYPRMKFALCAAGQ